jgi:two-component system sensor histidine kinase RegB
LLNEGQTGLRLAWSQLFGHGISDTMRLMTMTVARWIAVTGQLFTVMFVHFSIGIELPLTLLLPAIALSALLNLALTLEYPLKTRFADERVVLLFGFDVIQLGFLLAVTGGLNNPFSTLIALPVALGATTLDRLPTIGLTALTVLIVILLAFAPWPLPWFDGGLTLPTPFIAAECVSISLAVVMLAAYAWHMADQARLRSAALQAAQMALAREQQLSALGGQAAAAAHLLGSPLGTINIVAKELINEFPEDDPAYQELQILLSEAKRCRDILAELGRKPGEDAHSRYFERAPITAHIQDLAEQFPRFETNLKVETVIEAGCSEPVVSLTPEIRHALNNLIDNALHFANSAVTITWYSSGAVHRLTVDDDGPGFTPESLDWLGEPFHSSRSKSGGLGLGIFIATTLLERSGARMRFCNTENGARVEITWKAGTLEAATEESNQ